MTEYPHGQVRAVTHHGITAADIDATLAATRAALDETGGHHVSSAPNTAIAVGHP
jgi:hypothetical protein